MDELDDDGMAVYRNLRLHTIVDLRRPDEVAEAPTPRFGDERNVHLSVSTGNNAFAEASARADHPDGADEVLAKAGEYYRSLVTERLPLWKPVFDAILDAGGAPVLFHCTAGKDRTGFVAAALLKFLDVDDEVVFADYALTTAVRAPYVERRLEHHRTRMAELHGVHPDDVATSSIEAWRLLMSAPVELLQVSFDAVAEDWGGWHDMRRHGLGIADERLAAWRRAVVDT